MEQHFRMYGWRVHHLEQQKLMPYLQKHSVMIHGDCFDEPFTSTILKETC
jgi:hypothetical protein